MNKLEKEMLKKIKQKIHVGDEVEFEINKDETLVGYIVRIEKTAPIICVKNNDGRKYLLPTELKHNDSHPSIMYFHDCKVIMPYLNN